MSDDLSLDEDDLMAAERAEVEREFTDYRQFIDEHVESDWIWNDTANTLTHPDDPEIHYWINPHTYKRLLSPKLVDRAEDAIIRQLKAARGDSFSDSND